MTVETTAKVWTWEDWENLPDEEGKHYEIIEGELFVNASPVPRHQRVVKNLLVYLELYFREHGNGEVLQSPIGVVISQINVVQPDLVVMVKNGAWTIDDKRIHGAPDLLVEVVSKGNRRHDEVRKKAIYESYGVQEYWIVDPEAERVRIFRRGGERFVHAADVSMESGGDLTSPLLPNFSLDVADVFQIPR